MNRLNPKLFFLNQVTKRDVLAKEKNSIFLQVSCDFRFSRKMALKFSTKRLLVFKEQLGDNPVARERVKRAGPPEQIAWKFSSTLSMRIN